MKQLFFRSAIIGFCTLNILACNKKEIDTPSPEPEPPVETITLLKDWNVDSMKMQLSVMGFPILDSTSIFDNGQYSMNFINDSLVVITEDGNVDTTKYVVDQNKIIIEDEATFNYILTANNLTLQADEDIVDEDTQQTYNIKMDIFATKK